MPRWPSWAPSIIGPHRRGRKRPKTQDGRPLRRYKRRRKVERLFAWLGNFWRLVVRYERHALNYLGFVHLGCLLILLRQGSLENVWSLHWATQPVATEKVLGMGLSVT